MEIIGFPSCCGAGILHTIYHQYGGDHTPENLPPPKEMKEKIQKCISHGFNMDGSPRKDAVASPAQVGDYRRTVLVAILTDRMKEQKEYFLSIGGKLIGSYINRREHPLKRNYIWLIPVQPDADIKIGE